MLIDAWALYEELMNKDKCKNCDRKIIENMRTKNGCIWCDEKYYKENR